jgi:hypothetical protein
MGPIPEVLFWNQWYRISCRDVSSVGSKLELSQETVQLQGVVALPYASSRSHWPGR